MTAITVSSILNNPLIIGEGLVGSALANALPNAALWSRSKGFELADEMSWPNAAGHDVAFFCAAIARMQSCQNDPAATSHINVTQTMKLMARLQQNGVHCIFLSTDKVFDGHVPHVAVDAPTDPQNEYGRQKVQVEKWCKAHGASVLRLTKIIGEKADLFDSWMAAWAKGEAVEAFQDMSLAPVWIGDVVDALLAMGNARIPGIQQISGSDDVSYAYLARRMAPLAELVVPIGYAAKGIPAHFVPEFTSYATTIGIARPVDEVLSLWRAAQKPAKSTDI